jgi:4-diphosphocytidyl-2-C-methyl-D-erythritol kinase
MRISEIARAKINLTLTVLGRRADGYHEIESLVTFADIGDRVTLFPGTDGPVTTTGPFAGDITGHNLLDKALAQLRGMGPGLHLGAVELEKNLPVAAGLGGGSADTAALLRAVRRANPERASIIAWHQVASRLGADVPVCLAGRSALIRGIGDRVEPLEASREPPSMAAVLVNPRLPLATAQVYQALAAPTLSTDRPRPVPIRPFQDLESLVGCMRKHGNDLEGPATRLLPLIADIKSALSALPGCRIAALSGSGPTCFGIFADRTEAIRGAAMLAAAKPGYWVVPTLLAGGGVNSPG